MWTGALLRPSYVARLLKFCIDLNEKCVVAVSAI